MKRRILLAMLLVVAMVVISACNNNKGTVDEVDPVKEEMLENKISFVGDHNGVSKLVSFLPEFDENYKRGMYSLQTNTEPYGMTLYYNLAEGSSGEPMKVDPEMTKYAEYLFLCIENLGYVEYFYTSTLIVDNISRSSYTSLLKVEREIEEE
jgi:hypothetical protein